MLAFLFNPSGRIGRAKWWLAQLVVVVIAIFVLVMAGIIKSDADQTLSSMDLTLAAGVVVLAILLLWMTFCVAAKRYHDRNKSAWWYLIQFIPLIGPIWQFVELGFCSGDDAGNDYGPRPDFNIDDDLRTMKMARKTNEAYSTAQRPAYQSASASNNGGRQAFGKRS